MEGIGEKFLHPDTFDRLDDLDRICQELSHEFNQYAGVIIENKGLTLSVHYRLTPEHLVSQVEDSFNSVVAPGVADQVVKITRGKKVFEVRPNVEWDKGKAITRIMEVYFDAPLAAYFGDDLTDEAGFRVVQDASGIAVLSALPGSLPGLCLGWIHRGKSRILCASCMIYKNAATGFYIWF